MSDGNVLSQEEIDALLQGDFGLDDMDDEEVEEEVAAERQGIFEPEHIRTLLDIAEQILVKEVGVFKAYVNNQEVVLSKGRLTVVDSDDLQDELANSEHIFISADFDSGKSAFVITGLTASMIAQIMTAGSYDGVALTTFSELELSALQDCFNSLVGKVVPALKATLGKDFQNSPPASAVLTGKDIPPDANLLKENGLVLLTYDLNIGDEPPSQFRYVLSENLAKEWVTLKMPGVSFGGDSADEEVDLEALGASFDQAVAQPPQTAAPAAAAPAAAPAPAGGMAPPPPQQPPMGGAQPQMDPSMMQQPQMDPNMMQQMMAQQQQMMQQMMAQQAQPGAAPQAAMQQPGAQMGFSPWQFAPVTPFAVDQEQLGNMELLKDVSLQVTVELGRARLPIGQILEFTNGSIVELNKQAGEAVELYVQGKLIARGEVVIIDENFGIRITSIVSPKDRLEALRGKY
jgi:flagellar motor switch protein FliN/FliY